MSIIRVAVYARVSTKPQAGEDRISIPDQLRECKSFGEREGWKCVAEFVDPGTSANILDRPGLKALLSSLEQFDVIVAWDFDRFYRERRSVAGYILDTLDEHRKQITSVKQPIPIYSPAEYDPRENDTPYVLREMAGLTAGIDNRRRFRTLQKGLKERFEQGYMMHPPAYGYEVAFKIENGKVTKLPRRIIPKEAQIIRRIFHEYVQGKSYRHISHGLTAEGISPRRKPYWSPSTVAKILRNPVYCGKVYRASRKIQGKLRRLPEGQWTVIPGKHPPIVNQMLWSRVQAIRKKNRMQPRSVGSPMLLSGLLRCGYCEASMYHEGGCEPGYYSCGKYRELKMCQRNPYRRATLEADVTTFVFRLMRNEDLSEHIQNRQEQEQLADLSAELKSLEKELAEFPQRKHRLFDLYEAGQITRLEFTERKAEHDRICRLHESVFQDKRARLAAMQSARMDRDAFRRNLLALEENWEHCPIMEKKRMLSNLIEKIVLRDGTFKIHFRTGF